MKKACSACLSNCLRLHGARGENEDVAACLLCASRRPEEDEHQNQQRTQADRNPSFLKKMAKSTMSTLKLPSSFVRDQIDRLDGSVILEGPSKGKWRVELQDSSQSFSLNFGQGWEKFVADHVLQVDDILTFSLSAKSYFQVEIYDGGGCLKTSALDAEVAEVARPVAEAARPVADLVEVARPIAEVVQAVRCVAEVAEAARSVAKVPATEVEVADAARSEGFDEPDLGDGLNQLAKSDQGGLLPEHQVVRGNVISRRRPVTELEKERALQAAESLELANPNVLLVMSKQNVYRGFWLQFPKHFAKELMPSENKDVKIVNKCGNSWPAKWIAGRGGLSSGWRRFSLDHRLDEHDVCVLELIDKAKYVLLVHIFRVLGCTGEDLGLYTRTLSPDKRNKRKSFNCHEADGTPGEGPLRKSSRRAVRKDKHTLEPNSATKTLKCKIALLGDDFTSPGDAAVLRDGNGAGEQGESRAVEGTPTAPRQSLKPTSGLLGDCMASSGDATVLIYGSGARMQGESRAAEDTPTAPGDTAVLRAGNGVGEQVERGAAEGTPTASQEVLVPISLEQDGHKADGTPGERSGRKRNRSRRDVRLCKHESKRRLLAKGKGLASTDLEEIGGHHSESSDGELLVNIQRRVDRVSPMNRAGGAGDEIALRASGARKPQPVLALVCYDNGKPPGQKRSGDQDAEHSSSGKADFYPEVHYINPDEVHEQILHAPVTGSSRGRKDEKRQEHIALHNPDEVHEQILHAPVTAPFKGRKKEKRQEYKVVHIYRGRNVGNGTEFLTELQGYSESRSFANLDRDDDTGFWWISSDQFGWDMMRCYIG